MKRSTLLVTFGILCAAAFIFSFGCTKNTNPTPPVHDTITVVHKDTIYVPQPVDSASLRNGLVLYLPFNGSMADSSGNNNTITAVGGPTLDYDMHGYAQSAFTSPVDGARLEVTNSHGIHLDTAFSISLDFMINANPYFNGGYDFHNLPIFFSYVDPSTGRGPTFNVGLSLPASPQFFTFNTTGSANQDCSSFGGGSYISDTTNFIPQVGAWYNTVCTFNRNTVSVYINGKLINTRTNAQITSALFCPNSKFIVGGWWDGGGSGSQSIRGKLDEVRVYNRTLTAKEVAYLSRNFQLNSTSVKRTYDATPNR